MNRQFQDRPARAGNRRFLRRPIVVHRPDRNRGCRWLAMSPDNRMHCEAIESRAVKNGSAKVAFPKTSNRPVSFAMRRASSAKRIARSGFDRIWRESRPNQDPAGDALRNRIDACRTDMGNVHQPEIVRRRTRSKRLRRQPNAESGEEDHSPVQCKGAAHSRHRPDRNALDFEKLSVPLRQVRIPHRSHILTIGESAWATLFRADFGRSSPGAGFRRNDTGSPASKPWSGASP